MFGVVWERDRQKGSCPVDRRRSEEMKEVRSRLPPKTIAMSGPGRLLGPMSGVHGSDAAMIPTRSVTPDSKGR